MDDLVADDGETLLKNHFVSWLIHRIFDSVSLLDAKASTCLASMNSLTSLACSLISFYFSTDITGNADETKAWTAAKTKSLEAYSKIMLYILSKYEARSAGPLKKVCKSTSVFPVLSRNDLVLMNFVFR